MVAEWYGAGLAIARSWVRIPPVAAVYQIRVTLSRTKRCMALYIVSKYTTGVLNAVPEMMSDQPRDQGSH